ncbi:hypothetical protein ACFZ8E_14730 [Methylobacterium sp. HMF5984]|uniref:hypothetical protein n=1 Tax=Methylobacterium sp. HMF5984 TaxID=3367370 RepID=UPI0038538323
MPNLISDKAEDKNALIILDFDHTLFASNSTEMFIQNCEPSFLISLIDFIARHLIPWKIFGLPHYYRLRDYACCSTIAILTPWNIFLWRRRAPSIFEKFNSRVVSNAFSEGDIQRTIIASFGICWIIKPLLKGSRWQSARLIATPAIASLGFFSLGKLKLVQMVLPDEATKNSTCITDSLDDQDLLQFVRNGLLIDPQGDDRKSSHKLYLPMRYTIAAKYPKLYVVDQLFFVDILISIAAIGYNFSSFLQAFLIVPWLIISVMCIYELGYYENDMTAALKEIHPSVTPQVKEYKNYPIKINAWLWASGLGTIGIIIGSSCDIIRANFILSEVIWIIALLAIRTIFYFYNMLPINLRVYLYPFLQATKYLSVFLLIAPTFAGLTLVFSQISQMSFRYYLYRNGMNNSLYNRDVLRLIFFIICAVCLAAYVDYSTNDNFSFFICGGFAFARLLKKPILRYAAINKI